MAKEISWGFTASRIIISKNEFSKELSLALIL
jgi:hypothetical protein